MIKVTGEARLVVRYSVSLDMTEEDFEKYSQRKQSEILDEAIDWKEVFRSAETDDIEVWDIETTKSPNEV